MRIFFTLGFIIVIFITAKFFFLWLFFIVSIPLRGVGFVNSSTIFETITRNAAK
jgi:hypothetical protein